MSKQRVVELGAPLLSHVVAGQQTHLQLPRQIEWPHRTAPPSPGSATPAAQSGGPRVPRVSPCQCHPGTNLQRHRSAPSLHLGTRVSALRTHRPSPKLIQPEPQLEARTLPEPYETGLLSDEMRSALIEQARQWQEELVILVEMRPVVRTAVGSLHQDAAAYQQQLAKLTQAVDGAIRSHKHPADCYFATKVAQLPESWGNTDNIGPAFFDWRQATHQSPIASNMHRAGVAASRLGAYEVYMIWKPSRPGPVEVEQLFSKLFSRCWPRVDSVLRRLRTKPYVTSEMQLREGRYELRMAMSYEDKEAIRALVNQQRLRPDWPILGESEEAKMTIEHLAQWDSIDAANAADPVLRQAINACNELDEFEPEALERYLSQLENAAVRHLRFASPSIAEEVNQLLRHFSDIALGMLLESGGRELYDKMQHRLEVCSPDVAEEVNRQLELVAQHEANLASAIASAEAANIIAALGAMEHKWSPAPVAAAFDALKPILSADAALKSAIASQEKEVIEQAAVEHVKTCSPTIAEEVRLSISKVSDTILKKLLITGDKTALEQAIMGPGQHLSTCSSDVAESVNLKREELELSEAGLKRAMDSGEAALMIEALADADAKFLTETVAAVHAKLKPLLASDAPLKEAIRTGDVFSPATARFLTTCSRSVAQEVRWKAIDVADHALTSVMNTGDRRSLERTYQAYSSACSLTVARDAEQKLASTRQLETALQAAIQSGEAAELAMALKDPQVRMWSPQLAAACQAKLEATTKADAGLRAAHDRGDTTLVLEMTDGKKAQLSGCSPSVIEDMRYKIISNADGELYAILKTGDKAKLEEAAKHRLKVCSKFCRDDVNGQLYHVRKTESKLRKAVRTREAFKIKRALFECDRKWSPEPMAKAEAAMNKILEADQAIADSMMASTDPLWVIRKMTEAIEHWEDQASPSVIEMAIKDVEAMKVAPSKAMKSALIVSGAISSTLGAALMKVVRLTLSTKEEEDE